MDFINITFFDILDIVAVATIMYYIYKFTRGTQAPSILVGIMMIYVLWFVVRVLKMELLSAILGQLVGVGMIAIIVVFQPEIRRFLHMLGNRGTRRQNSFFGKLFTMEEYRNEHLEYVHPIVKACTDMSAAKTGALIVIQRTNDLTVVAETGIIIDARVSSSLLKNIFFRNSPLHDGAVLINKGRIVAAKCVLPSTESEVPMTFGMRHRAAIGITEVSDARVVVVSEETGRISIAEGGKITTDLTPSRLQAELLRSM